MFSSCSVQTSLFFLTVDKSFFVFTGTCNQFDHDTHVLPQWKVVEKVVNELLGDVLIPIGNASDGDARRVKNQIAAMKCSNFLPPDDEKLTIDMPGFVWSAQYTKESLFDDGSECITGVRRIHSQDPIHKIKLLDTATDKIGILSIGTDMATHNACKRNTCLYFLNVFVFLFRALIDLFHLLFSFPISPVLEVSAKCDDFDHDLTRNSLLREDRQNFGDCILRSSLATEQCLISIGENATALLFQMHRRYMLIFFGTRITMKERVVNAGYIIQFMRLQRLFCKHHKSTSIANNSWTYQTFVHVQLSVHSVVLLIKATREFCPSIDFGGAFVGSDCCEDDFRTMCGFGKVKSMTRNDNVAGCLNSEGRNATLKVAQVGEHGIVVRKRTKLEFNSKFVEDMTKQIASKKATMDDAEIIAALEEGKNLATADLAVFDVKPVRNNGCIPNLEFDEPWRSENDDLKMIRGGVEVGRAEWDDLY